MANIRQIKRRIKAAQNTSKITKAMEMVAASKMMRAQQRATDARPYAKAIWQSLKTVAQFTQIEAHPLLQKPKTGRAALVIFATDKGLCGSLNTNLFKATHVWSEDSEQPYIIAVGRKAVHFVNLLGLEMFAQFTDLPESPRFEDILPVGNLVIEKFLDGTFKSVDILYTDFINTLSQAVSLTPLLPISGTPSKEETAEVSPQITSEYTFEPSIHSILDQLLPFYVENTIYQSILEASASEHSARMVAMKNASENANELVGELKLLFNKSRQANITSELLDITTAILSLN
jgi:F-type H+-transporting ATPase subunit gamma